MVSVMPPFVDEDALLPALVALGVGIASVAYFLTRQSKKANGVPRRQILTLNSWRPLIGDLTEFAKNAERLHEWMAEKSIELKGEPWRIHIAGLKNMVVITSPELVEEVLTTQFANFPRGQQQINVLADLLGFSLVASDGDKWFHQRKTASKFFTARALRVCMTQSIRRNLTELNDVFDATIAKCEPVDLIKLFHEFTMQTFAEAGLGVKLNLIGREEPHPLDAVGATSPVIMRRMRVPEFYWKLERWLNIGQERQIATTMAGVREWLDSVITQSLAAAEKRQRQPSNEAPESAGNEDVKSVLELFLEQSSEDKDGLRAEDLVDFILTFVLAARGTSAVALVWIFMMIAQHPHVEQRLRDEMAKVLPHVSADTYLTTDHISSLVYLEATIKEVLRLYPTIPALHKEAACDTEIGDGLKIKKGEIVSLIPFAMARLPNVWGPDAAEFKPERWIDEKTGQLIVVPSSKFLSFGSGPRICIGMKLAMLELRVTAANLLNRYRFTLAQPNDRSHLIAVELMPATPVMMNASLARQPAASA